MQESGFRAKLKRPKTNRGNRKSYRELAAEYENLVSVHKGKSRMTLAVQSGDMEAVAAFLEQGDDPNERDTNYSTPLIHLAWPGHLKLAEALILVRSCVG